jgi:protein O-mannosyl-transferase
MSRPRLIALLLGLATLLVFAPAGSFQFVNYDDPDYVTGNPVVQQGLTPAGIQWAFTTGWANNWHPLTWLSHMTDCELFKLNAGAHHLVNVLFHAANAMLLFVLLFRLTQKIWAAAFVAALFAWHPLHVESVAWVAERKDVLSTFFALLSLLSYANFAELSKVQSPKSKVHFGLSLVFFALGLMAKPMLVTLPLVMLLLDFWPLQRVAGCRLQGAGSKPVNAQPTTGSRQLVFEKWPFFLLAVPSCFATVWAQSQNLRDHAAVVPLGAVPLGFRLGNLPLAYVGYLEKFFWPANLAVFYPRPSLLLIPRVAADALILLAISVAAWRWRKTRPYFLVGWLWFLGMLVPVSGLVQVGGAGMADRYTYLPLVGIFILIAFAAGEIVARFPTAKIYFCAGSIFILAACVLATERQLAFWKNTETLFSHDLAAAEDNDVARNNLGLVLEARGDWSGALEQFQAAARLAPKQPVTRVNLGNLLDKLGHPAEALAEYRAAIELRPDDPDLLIRAAHELNLLGQFNAALAELAIAKNRDPNSPRLHVETARSFFKLGRDQDGVAEFMAAVKLAPDDYQILAETAHYLSVNENAAARDGKLALALALKADEISGHQNPMVLDALGGALAETGDFTNAVIYAQKVLDLATAAQVKKLEPLRRRLECYQNGQPWRESFRATNAPAAKN